MNGCRRRLGAQGGRGTMRRRGGRGGDDAGKEEVEAKAGGNEMGKWSVDVWVWLGCLALRMLNALLVRTYFNPDEHWQVLEVAHRIVFGYGHLTWEWSQGLRSYLHPLIFAALYSVLQFFGLDKAWLMVKAARLLQGFIAAFGDLYLFKLGCRIFGRRAAQWALFCQLTNWFTFFCIVRTFSNSLETVITVVALYYWPLPSSSSPHHVACWRPLPVRQLGLALAALSCMVRPTSAIIWLYMGFIHLLQTQDKLRFIFAEVFPTGSFAAVAACLLDSWMYGRMTFVPWRFLRFNFFSAGGDFYGTHPWHWYFSQGFPAMAFSFLPLTVAGIWWSGEWLLSGLLAWTLGIYSFLGHKEFRFVLPVLPVAMLFAGYALFVLERTQVVPSGSAREKKPGTVAAARRGYLIRWMVFGLLMTNVPVALYTSLVHQIPHLTPLQQIFARVLRFLQRGPEAVMEYLAEEAEKGQVQSIVFLMPCHSTPFYSSLHKNVTMRFLDCSPSNAVGYKDEADQFMEDPLRFLSSLYGNEDGHSLLPSHVVLFDSLLPRINYFLEQHSFKRIRRLFHAHVPVDRELQSYVLVYARQHVQ